MKRFKKSWSIALMGLLLMVVASCLNLKQSPFSPVVKLTRSTTSPNAYYFTLRGASQNDSRWTCNQLGTCSNYTMGTCSGRLPGGCAVNAVWMLSTANRSVATTPADLNRWLTNNGGYSGGCSIIWSRAADFDGPYGLTWVGTNTLSSPTALKSLLDSRYLIVAKSHRFSEHWVAVQPSYGGSGTDIRNFGYLDPWDGTCRIMGDGLVYVGVPLRVYRMQ